jgi:hypothetical protein
MHTLSNKGAEEEPSSRETLLTYSTSIQERYTTINSADRSERDAKSALQHAGFVNDKVYL